MAKDNDTNRLPFPSVFQGVYFGACTESLPPMDLSSEAVHIPIYIYIQYTITKIYCIYKLEGARSFYLKKTLVPIWRANSRIN